METNKLSLVRQRAKKLYSKYGLSVPVDLNVIIRKKQINVLYKENQVGIDGLCHLQKNPPEIIINTEMTYLPRRRFTIAHELGHICIPWHTGIDLCSLDDPYVRIQGQQMVNTQELEANIFASELLMPADWIKNRFDLNTEDLEELITSISNEANTSYMACCYALENVLPAGDIFFVKTDAGEFWKPFRSIDTGSIRISIINSIPFYDKICYWKNEFKISVYNIIHYKLIPKPDISSLNNIYLACDSDLEKFLGAITNGIPIRAMHYLDTILNEIGDKLYVVVKIEDVFFRHIRTKDTSIRMHVDEYYDINALYKYISKNFYDYGRIELSPNSTILWVKERWRGKKVNIYSPDPHELLKNMIKDIYPIENATHMLQSINGVIAAINGRYPNVSQEQLYHYAKLRFDTDPYYKEFVIHPDYEHYISGKIKSLMKKRKA